jgi:poly(rC)-binding protein 2/3/4
VRLVTISGTVQEVCSAVELIARQAGLFGITHRRGGSRGGDAMDEDDPYADDYYPHGLRLVIDAANAGQLIGKKGATINEIRTNSGARVQLVSDEESAEEGALEGERVVVLTGDPEACRLAHKLICSVLAAAAANAYGGGGSSSSPGGHDRGGSSALPPSGLPSTSGGSSSFFSGGEALADSTFRHHQSYEGDENEEEFDNAVEVVMRIPNEKIGRVIGQGGTTINQIRTDSGCRIDIENTRSGEHALRVIRITGNMAQTQAAQALIQEKVTSEALV